MTDSTHHARAILSLTGEDMTHFLQGILTQDIAKLPQEKILFAALLSPQGKILHDMFVVEGANGEVLLDTPALYKDTLLKRLALYKLRAKVTIADASERWFVSYVTTGGLKDPRHPQLPQRRYSQTLLPSTVSDSDYQQRRLSLGIPDSAYDFAPDEIVALDAGYDLLHAVSFTKGCYVGQEVTARMHYKNIARKSFYLLTQNGIPQRLAVLRFDEMGKSSGTVNVEGTSYDAQLPDWMLPKWEQFTSASKENPA